MPIMNIFYVIVAQVTFYVSDLTEAFFYLIIFTFFPGDNGKSGAVTMSFLTPFEGRNVNANVYCGWKRV